jgi:hypothetical protein
MLTNRRGFILSFLALPILIKDKDLGKKFRASINLDNRRMKYIWILHKDD